MYSLGVRRCSHVNVPVDGGAGCKGAIDGRPDEEDRGAGGTVGRKRNGTKDQGLEDGF